MTTPQRFSRTDPWPSVKFDDAETVPDFWEFLGFCIIGACFTGLLFFGFLSL